MNPPAPRRLPSLATRLWRHVLLPLALTWLAGTALALSVAQWFTQRAFDRSLLDDAYLLAANVRQDGDRLKLALSEREVNTVLFDQAETMFFGIYDDAGQRVAGLPNLRLPEPPEGGFRYDDVMLDGRTLRAVVLHRATPAQFHVVVAQTTSVRAGVLRQLLLVSLAPQLILLVLLAVWLRRAIDADLRPLAQFEAAVGQRSANDLAPVPVDARSREVTALAQALNALLTRLDGSVRAQREFAGNVAHELRTPLAGIRALASYGLAHQEPAVWREQLAAIAASEARASRLVDKLLDIALAREAEAGLRLAPVALHDLVRESVLRFLPQADAAGVDLGAQGVEEPVWVQGDPTLVEGLLHNLIDNALRYGVPTDDAPTVTVAVERRGQEVLLSVQDNGPGLPGEQQAQLLRRGAQGETGQMLGQGAGLGLALVAQYAQLMKAGLTLGSGPGGRGWLCTVAFAAADSEGKSAV